MKASFRSYGELCKVRVALLAACSAATGFLLAAPAATLKIGSVSGGVFLLACGSLALNQYQERKLDAAMPRTWVRPLPSGRISPGKALLLAGALLVAGFAALLLTGNLAACALALGAPVWYDGVYTFLKRKSAFAVIPGALIGAIPPAVGWIAGGGAWGDPKLPMLCLFFFLWQIPHAWLFITRYGREYEQAGMPSLTQVFTGGQLQRLTFNWMLAATAGGLLLPVMGLVHHRTATMVLLFLSAWFLWHSLKSCFQKSDAYAPLSIFKKTNYYLLAMLFILSVDKAWSLGMNQ